MWGGRGRGCNLGLGLGRIGFGRWGLWQIGGSGTWVCSRVFLEVNGGGRGCARPGGGVSMVEVGGVWGANVFALLDHGSDDCFW